MSDPNDVEQVKPGVTVTRAPGKPPVRKDTRGLAEVLHDAIGQHLGIEPKHQGKPIDEVVDDAITGAQGAHPDY